MGASSLSELFTEHLVESECSPPLAIGLLKIWRKRGREKEKVTIKINDPMMYVHSLEVGGVK